MYYPNSSDEETFFIPPPPNDTFHTSWCRNGHGLRLEPGAVVHYLVTWREDPHNPPKQRTLMRNGHGHPTMHQGVVHAIHRATQTVDLLGSAEAPHAAALIHHVDWDLVVGREDSRHRSIPVALMGTREEGYPSGRRTLEFGPLQRAMPDLKRHFVARLLVERGCDAVPPPGSLAALALEALLERIALQAAADRVSFFNAAEQML